MTKHQLLFVVLLIFFGSSTAYPQVQFDENCRQAYNHILSLQLDEAEALLDDEEKQHPDNAYVPYLRNYIDFISVFISQDEDLYNLLDDQKSNHFSKVGQLSDTNRYKKLMLGNMHLQWAISKIIFGDLFTGAIEFNKAYHLVEDNTEEFPGFKLNQLSMGVLHIIVGLVPDKYGWLLGLLSLEGDIDQGKNELSQFLSVAENQDDYNAFYPEALFYSGFIEMNIYPNKQKLHQIRQDVSQVSDSVLLLKFLELNLLMRSGANDEALILFRRIANKKIHTYPFAYLDYLYGESQLRSLNTDSARYNYTRFITNYRGKNYIKDAWRKKAWTAFLNDDTTLYFNYLKRVLKEGTMQLDVDKEAYHEAQKGLLPDKQLLTARLLFDGGYYEKTQDLLNNIDTSGYTALQQVKYIYRLARVSDKLGTVTKAKTYYLQAIIKGTGFPEYYAANAAFKLGEIYEREGELKLAEENYALCLDMDFELYKNSITTRAKEGLKRVHGR